MKIYETGKKYNLFGKKVNCLLCFPDSYKIGMSSLAFLNIYRLLNENPYSSCERFFLNSNNKTSYESNKPISNFDIIFLTVSYEKNIQNIRTFFNNNKYLITDIKLNNKRPVFIVGGQLIKLYPDLFKDEFDIVFNGDFEILLSLMNTYLKNTDYFDKCDFIDYLNNYILTSTKKYFFSDYICSYSNICTSQTVFQNTFLIELTRGCPNKCNFCISGKNLSYFRTIKYDDLINIFEELKEYKINKYGIIGLSVLKYKHFKELCLYGIENNLSFNFSSLEVSELNEENIELLNRVNQKTFTLAPENFSPEILKILNKTIDLETIPEKIELLNKYNITNLKLYLIYGIEEETIEDLDINIMFIKNISALFKGRITLSFNILIPKPGTPFENRMILPKKLIKEKRVYLQKELLKLKNVNMNFIDYNEALSQIQY